MKVRTGPGPLDWRDEGPQSAHLRLDHYSVQANTGSAMMPILKGTVLSKTSPDGSHDVTDARLRRKYSIHPENRT